MRYLICVFLLLTKISWSQDLKYYQDSIAKEIKNIKSDSLKAQRFYDESVYILGKLGKLELSKLYTDSSFFYAKKSGFKELKAKCHFRYGMYGRFDGNFEEALKHLDTNLVYFKNDSIPKAKALYHVAVIRRKQGEYEKSLKAFLRILNIFENEKDSIAIAHTLGGIANVYGNMKQLDKAIDNYNKANAIYIKKDQKKDIARLYYNISSMQRKKGDTLLARANAEKSLKISKDLADNTRITLAHFRMAGTYLSSDREKALYHYKQAEAFTEKKGFNHLLMTLYNDLGIFYLKEKKYNLAISYFKKSENYLNDNYNNRDARKFYNGLYSAYAASKNFEEAFRYQSKYIKAKDSILNETNLKNIKALELKYNTEKKDKAILSQQLAIEQKDVKLQKKNNQMLILYGVSAILLLSTVLIWRIYAQKQKRKAQEVLALKRHYQIQSLEALIEGEEQERFRIARELHDGVNGDLSAIKFKLSTLLEENNKVITEAISMIDASCKQVRAISHNLVPPSLENFNLTEATENYCHDLDEIHNEHIQFSAIGDEFSMPKKAEVNSFRIIQELLSNSLKHAEATEINVQISCRNHQLQITVEDNGKGFNKETIKTDGIGLKNIASRIEYLNAEVDFLSNEKGTSYTFEMDLKQFNDD